MKYIRDQMRGPRLPPKSDYDKLNELIDWYEKFGRPEAGKIIAVKFSQERLNEFATRIEGTNRWRYRERILEKVPT